MSVLDRMRAAVRGTIDEIKEARRAATAELIAFKAGDKVMAARAEELAAEAAEWQRRAEQAVRAGNDELAREALERRGWVIAELAQLRADREESAWGAKEMLRARRELDAKLQSLELRQGTVASGLGAIEQAENERQLWDRFEDAEKKIEEDSIEAELAEGEMDATDLARQKVGDLEKSIRAGTALAELKRRMKSES